MQYIHVKVIAGAGKESWREIPDHFEISVEKAERNMANAAFWNW